MPIRIASRQSDLAKFQAYEVGEALQEHFPNEEIEYHFRESLGDINQEDPLWKMPEKGVFTQDFREGLLKDEWDIVVHSWKDLPVEQERGTEIVATLPRADQRDLLLLKKKSFDPLKLSRKLKVYSSSPRRSYNLKPFFQDYLPFGLNEVSFENVRGNILTRVRKLIESQDVDGLVVAKAAIDRLLASRRLEFLPGQKELKNYLDQCLWQVLPLTENPTAAAQGAIVIEISSTREDLKKMLKTIHCQETWDCVQAERKILKNHGGGCHQKIGVSQLLRSYGKVTFLKGETERSEKLNSLFQEKLELDLKAPCYELPLLFDRVPKDFKVPQETNAHFIARENALPLNFLLPEDHILWTAGLKTWKSLAKRGYWVHGSCESLGEQENFRLESLFPRAQWSKWTHDRSPIGEEMTRIASYELKSKVNLQKSLNQFKEFYWMSGTQFLEAIKNEPQILESEHFCGPGNTFNIISMELKKHNIKKKPQIVLNYEMWIQNKKG